MNTIVIASILGFSLGAAGYIIFRFWLLPIRRYRLTKDRITQNLNLWEAMLSGEDSFKPTAEMTENCRKHAVALTDAYYDDLPPWYRMVLTNRKESPDEATKSLQALSGIKDPDHAQKRIQTIKTRLHLS
jgi:hypothetical protein